MYQNSFINFVFFIFQGHRPRPAIVLTIFSYFLFLVKPTKVKTQPIVNRLRIENPTGWRILRRDLVCWQGDDKSSARWVLCTRSVCIFSWVCFLGVLILFRRTTETWFLQTIHRRGIWVFDLATCRVGTRILFVLKTRVFKSLEPSYEG